MSKRIAAVAVSLVVGAASLAALPVASATASSGWWQLSSASRPTHLWLPTNEVQAVQKGSGLTFVTLEGHPVACMGSPFCTFLGFQNAETASALQASLEAPTAYGPGNVEVADDPPSSGRFVVTSTGALAGRYVSPLGVAGGGGNAEVLTEGGSGRIVVTTLNLGDAPVDGSTTPVILQDRLPTGVSATHIGSASTESESAPVECAIESASDVGCSYAGVLAPYEAITVEVDVSLTSTDPAAPGQMEVSGGGAPRASEEQDVTISSEPTPFGIERVSMRAEQEGGSTATQAGSHPFQVTTAIQLNQGRFEETSGGGVRTTAPALPRNFRFRLPTGFVGNAKALPACDFSDFASTPGGETNLCPSDSVVGVASTTVLEPTQFGLARLAVPVFNIAPRPGEPARFGFVVAKVPVVLDTSVLSSEGYRVTASVENTPETAQVLDSAVTLWGNPSDARHDESRGWACVYISHPGVCAPPETRPEKPFLRLPTSCGQPLTLSAELEPWNVPLGTQVTSSSFFGTPLDGCNQEPFTPSIDVQPTTSSSESPSGLQVELKVPQGPSESPEGVSESDVRSTTVTLPPDLHVNAAAANGLQACSEQEMGFEHMTPSGEAVFDEAPAQCPDASKLGLVKISTPLLKEPVTGAVYQAAQGANPFGSLLALYVVADAPGAGVHVKLAGKVRPTGSGQLVSTFAETPQLPFEEFELNFFGGANAPLATSGCGPYTTDAQVEPWSRGPAAANSSSFAITSGAGGGACQSPPPASASFAAGTEAPLAGRYSPFVLRLTRDDGSQLLSGIDTKLPPGLLAKLAGIPYCPSAAIAQAQGRASAGEGTVEQAHPSCPKASEVGGVGVASGVGPSPVHVTGHAYLTGPYKGAPLSLVIVTPAVAGPFDLGTVVVRVALYVDPETAQVTAKSDSIPTILQGIPLSVRSISLRMDRPRFTLNPTSCRAMSVTGTAFSTLGQAVPLSDHFQVGGCGDLAFKPKLGLRLFGKTHRGANPRLRAILTMPRSGQANIAGAAVTLPHSEFLDQSHIKTVCTRVQFQSRTCPRGSVYGRAVATTPLFDTPLKGPVYLRSSSNRLPDLVAVLRGPASQPVEVDLDGRIDSIHGGIRNTFEVVPDAPVSKFTLEMRGGKRGLIVNSTNICSKHAETHAIARFTAQNGEIAKLKPKVQSDCSHGKGRSAPTP